MRSVFAAGISSCILMIGIFGVAGAQVNLDQGLIAHYPFDGNADDAGPFGNHGTPQPTLQLCPDRFGNADSAYQFNGVDSWITIPASASLDSPTSALSQTAWVNHAGMSHVGNSFNPILMKSPSSGSAFMYRLYQSETALCVSVGNWNTYAAAAASPPLDQWLFVASVWDGAECRFYVDGQFVAAEAFAPTMTPDGRDLFIGADFPGILEVFNGKIDDVRLYDRALNTDEIDALFAGVTTASPLPAATRPVLYQNSPNPFSRNTTIRYGLTAPTEVDLAVYDVSGRLVRPLVQGWQPTGRHQAEWDGRDHHGRAAPTGVYYYRLEAGDRSTSRRMVLRR